jgi:hypothetical protein
VVLRARTVSEIEAHELSVILTADKTECHEPNEKWPSE